MSLFSERIQDLLVLHRGLDSSDEDASNEEQAEKLLFFYSARGAADVQEKLRAATLVESLVALTGKFAKSSLRNVTMHNKSWSFLEAEPDVWIALSVLNDHSGQQTHCTSGVDFFLRSMYAFLLCFHGPIHGALTGRNAAPLTPLNAPSQHHTDRISANSPLLLRTAHPPESSAERQSISVDNNNAQTHSQNNPLEDILSKDVEPGWSLIVEIQQLSKALRKTRRRLDTAQRDLEAHREYLEIYREPDGANDTDHTNATRINGQDASDVAESVIVFQEEIERMTEKLESLRARPDYTLPQTKARLCAFIEWYLSTDELNDTSFFSALHSARSLRARQRVAPSVFPTLQIVRAIERATDGLVKGCMLLYDNRTLWTDFDASLSHRLCEFTQRWDATVFFPDGAVNKALRVALDDYVASLSVSTERDRERDGMKCEYTSLDPVQREKLAKILKGREERRNQRSGLLTTRGSQCDIDSFLLYLQHHLSHAESQGSTTTESSHRAKLSQFLTGIPLDNRVTAFFPRIHQQHTETKTSVSIGRLAVFFFGKLTVYCLIDEEQLVNLHLPAIQHLIATRGNAMLCEAIKAEWIANTLDELSNALSHTDANMHKHVEYPGYAEDVFRIQSLCVIAKLYRSLLRECEPLGELTISESAVGSAATNTIPAASTLRGTITPKHMFHKDRDAKVFAFTANKTLQKILSLQQTFDFFRNGGFESIDNVFLGAAQRSATAGVFLNSLVAQCGPVAVRALQDIWAQLCGLSYSDAELSLRGFSGSPATADFVCTRLSTPQRGGLWAIGQRVLFGEPLLVLVQQCATLNEALEVVQSVVEEITFSCT